MNHFCESPYMVIPPPQLPPLILAQSRGPSRQGPGRALGTRTLAVRTTLCLEASVSQQLDQTEYMPFFSLPFCHFAILPFRHLPFCSLPFCHFAILPICQFAILQFAFFPYHINKKHRCNSYRHIAITHAHTASRQAETDWHADSHLDRQRDR